MNGTKKNKIRGYSQSDIIKFATEMIRIRVFEEQAAKMYGKRKIGGFCHLYIGQEAVAVGSICASNFKKDYFITSYRDHAHAIVCGTDPKYVMAELFGKRDGVSKGKGGSMHLFDIKNRLYGGHGIVGGHIPLALGMAFKLKYKKEDGVVICYFGDGAIHMGTFHESMNMAKIYNVPLILVCENNQYGMGTSYDRISSIKPLEGLGKPYGIPSMTINTNDVLEVHTKFSKIIEETRNNGPYLCIMDTYRYKGHSMSDPAKYRSREELKEHKKSDPIKIIKDLMIDNKIMNLNEYDELKNSIKEEMLSAIEFAESNPYPNKSEIYTDIYSE